MASTLYTFNLGNRNRATISAESEDEARRILSRQTESRFHAERPRTGEPELIATEPERVPAAKLKSGTRQIEAILMDALAAAELHRCGCSAGAQDEMRLYLDTWVAGRIREALGLMAGELHPWQAEHVGGRS